MLADVRVRESGAPVEGDGDKSRRNVSNVGVKSSSRHEMAKARIADIYSFYSGQSLLHDGLRVVLRVGSAEFGGMARSCSLQNRTARGGCLQNPTLQTLQSDCNTTMVCHITCRQKQALDLLQG